jgi:hypothetical protein
MEILTEAFIGRGREGGVGVYAIKYDTRKRFRSTQQHDVEHNLDPNTTYICVTSGSYFRRPSSVYRRTDPLCSRSYLMEQQPAAFVVWWKEGEKESFVRTCVGATGGRRPQFDGAVLEGRARNVG